MIRNIDKKQRCQTRLFSKPSLRWRSIRSAPRRARCTNADVWKTFPWRENSNVDLTSRFAAVHLRVASRHCSLTQPQLSNTKDRPAGLCRPLPADARHSITFDRGLEFVAWRELETGLGTKGWFCVAQALAKGLGREQEQAAPSLPAPGHCCVAADTSFDEDDVSAVERHAPESAWATGHLAKRFEMS